MFVQVHSLPQGVEGVGSHLGVRLSRLRTLELELEVVQAIAEHFMKVAETQPQHGEHRGRQLGIVKLVGLEKAEEQFAHPSGKPRGQVMGLQIGVEGG